MHQVMDLASSAHRNGYVVIISGDFNTQLDVGPRGQLPRELSVICHLRITNEIHDGMDFDDHWTFESSMGVRRQIDFILCSARIPTIAVEATRAIDMGSDHRAVKSILNIGTPQQSRRRKKRVRGWKPRDVSEYHSTLDAALCNSSVTTPALLMQIVAESADHCKAKVENRVQKPWLTPHYHSLIATRRNENCRHERSRLSKCISRELHVGLRLWRTKKLQIQLEEFKDVKHGARIHDAPSVGVTRSSIEPQKFANSLAAVYKSDNDRIE